jgi:hypothetical protein
MKGNMTVGQLIEQLQQYDQDSEVRFAYNYGDRWRTLVAEPVRTIENGTVRYSEYHRMDAVTESEENDDITNVIILT